MTLAQQATFVGIDVGKQDLVLARHARPGAHSFSNTPDGIRDLIRSLRGERRAHVAFEATGGYEWRLWEALDKAGFTARQIVPAELRAFARSRGTRAKTDPIDAAQIAAFAAFRPEAGRMLSPGSVRDLRALVAVRRQRVTDKKRVQTRLKRLVSPDMRAFDDDLLALLEAQIAALNARIARQIAASPELARTARLLRSIPGIGPVLTATLLAEMPELGRITAKAAAALTGTAPMARDSGAFKGQRFIAGGRKPVRDVLFMAATVAISHNPDLKAFFEGLRDRGLPYKKAAIATARKLIILANTVVKRGTPWRPTKQI